MRSLNGFIKIATFFYAFCYEHRYRSTTGDSFGYCSNDCSNKKRYTCLDLAQLAMMYVAVSSENMDVQWKYQSMRLCNRLESNVLKHHGYEFYFMAEQLGITDIAQLSDHDFCPYNNERVKCTSLTLAIVKEQIQNSFPELKNANLINNTYLQNVLMWTAIAKYCNLSDGYIRSRLIAAMFCFYPSLIENCLTQYCSYLTKPSIFRSPKRKVEETVSFLCAFNQSISELKRICTINDDSVANFKNLLNDMILSQNIHLNSAYGDHIENRDASQKLADAIYNGDVYSKIKNKKREIRGWIIWDENLRELDKSFINRCKYEKCIIALYKELYKQLCSISGAKEKEHIRELLACHDRLKELLFCPHSDNLNEFKEYKERISALI